MSTLVRPSFHVLTLLCAASLCLVTAHAVSSVLDVWLQPLPSLENEPSRKAPSRKQEMPTPLALAPLARYLGLPDKIREEVIPAEAGEEAVPNTLGLKLLGTMTGAHPSATFASVYEGATHRTRSVWMGNDIQGAQVVAIERRRVLLWNSGRLEYIGPTASDAVHQGMEPGAPMPPAPAPGISVQQIGPRDYELSRKELDVALANPNDLLMQARVVPAIRDGAPQGFKMFSIRPGSLYSRIGLQNGDVLLRINGLSLGSVERGLEAFQTLRDASRIELELERNGQPMRLTYSLR